MFRLSPRYRLPRVGSYSLLKKGGCKEWWVHFSCAERGQPQGRTSRFLRPALLLISGIDHCRRLCFGACSRVVRVPPPWSSASRNVGGTRTGRRDPCDVPPWWDTKMCSIRDVPTARSPAYCLATAGHGALVEHRRPDGYACSPSAI